MNILHVARYTIIANLRDRKNFIRRLVMPLLLILILGTALNKAFAPVDLGTTAVAYLNEDTGSVSKNFDDFLAMDKVKEMLDVKKVGSIEEGQDLINDGDAAVLVRLDKSFSDSVTAGKQADIEIYSTSGNTASVTIVKSILDSFANGANTIQAVTKIGSTVQYDSSRGGLEEVPITTDGKKPSSMDYYAVTMLVLAIMAGALYGSDEMAQDYVGHIGQRMRTSPMRPYQHFFGKVLGCVFLVMLQAAIVFGVTRLAFHANWGDNFGLIALVVFTLAVFSTGLGVMMCMITKDQVRATSLLNLVVPFFTFIAGGYFKLDLENLMYLSPSYLAQTAIFNQIYGGSSDQTMTCILALWGLIAVIFAISMVGARRKLTW